MPPNFSELVSLHFRHFLLGFLSYRHAGQEGY